MRVIRSKNKTSAAGIVQAAIYLYEAAEKIDKAFSVLNGSAKTHFLNQLIRAERSAGMLAFSLENDYLHAALDEYKEKAPLIGDLADARAAMAWCDGKEWRK